MEHQALPAFAATSGPRSARTVFIAEAWGENEESLRKPLVGESGKEFFRMLGQAWPELNPTLHAAICAEHKYGLAWVKSREAWMEEASILFTNVFAMRPGLGSNKLEQLLCSKAELPPGYDWPALERGKYVRPEYLSEVDRLLEEITTVRPNLIVALGNVACWAVLRATSIGSIRGAVAAAAGRFLGFKVLATYHPAGVMRNWSWRPIVLADLMKAGREAAFPEIRRPHRDILINPTLADIRQFKWELQQFPPTLLAVDTETELGQIKTIGFATSRSWAISIPIWHPEVGSYWTEEEELEVWAICQEVLESGIPLLFQNGLYDLQYILPMGIWPKAPREDSMLLHHSLFPEMLKGLGFLGSIYTNESSWKLMRKRKKEAEKRDE